MKAERKRIQNVKAGLVGTIPKVLDPHPRRDDLRVNTAFRAVYATLLEDWLQVSAAEPLWPAASHGPPRAFHRRASIP